MVEIIRDGVCVTIVCGKGNTMMGDEIQFCHQTLVCFLPSVSISLSNPSP